MAPVIPALAQSESKARLLDRLGLNARDPQHKAIYALMKAEAIRDREAMQSSRDVLLSHFRDDMSIQPPYSSSQVTDATMRAAVIRIHENACPETKVYYDKGHDANILDETTGMPTQENWIIRWMLWHVFRYRDNRNKHRSQSSAISSTSATSPTVRTSFIPLNESAVVDGGNEYDDDNEDDENVDPRFPTAVRVVPVSLQQITETPRSTARLSGALPYDPARDV